MKRQAVPGFSMQDCLDERRARENRIAHAQAIGKSNGDKLLGTLLGSETGIMEFRVVEGDNANYDRWLHNCRDIIRAAANDKSNRYVWNNDWRHIGFLTIGVTRKRLAA